MFKQKMNHVRYNYRKVRSLKLTQKSCGWVLGKVPACSHVLSSQLCFRHIVDAQEMDEKELKGGNLEIGEHTEGGFWDLSLGSAISPRKGLVW